MLTHWSCVFLALTYRNYIHSIAQFWFKFKREPRNQSPCGCSEQGEIKALIINNHKEHLVWECAIYSTTIYVLWNSTQLCISFHIMRRAISLFINFPSPVPRTICLNFHWFVEYASFLSQNTITFFQSHGQEIEIMNMIERQQNKLKNCNLKSHDGLGNVVIIPIVWICDDNIKSSHF